MRETRSDDHAPSPGGGNDAPAKRTRDTRAVPTDRAPGESREYPEVPGYEILGICGHGGMGVLYRARQLGANRLVALKMIRAVEHASPTDRLRFQIEAEAVARLQHAHIVQLYEAGEVRGQPFFSLEFCDGGTLTEQLKKRRPTPGEAAALIESLARAMHYAHLRGVVHRDLKPGNVLLTGAERVAKITDFGLAKRIDAEAREVSQSGAIMGTASYMAPEQAAGRVRDTGPAADVYALGALLYECLTGRPPFEGPQQVVLVSVLSDEPVQPSRRVPKVPADLETICLKCLSKEPARRYASAEELANDLRRFQAGEPIRARPVGAAERTWKWAKRRPALAALVGVVLLALVGLTALSAVALDREQKARQEADKAKKARDFLVSIFELSDARTQASALTPRQVLDDAERRIPKEFAGQPELQAELQTAIDRVYAKITENAPLAMILEARGRVQLASTRDASQRPVPQALLYAGDRLSLGEDGQVRLVVLSDLHQEWLRPGREATVGRKGCAPADAIAQRTDDVLMTFVRLPKGTFYMGWDGAHKGVKTEIKEDFEIAVHDVTQGQWQAVMGENPSYFSRFGGGRNEVKTLSDEELKLLPVETVSWYDAQEFIRRLNERERGRGYVYRLPTEGSGNTLVREGPLLRQSARTTSTSTSRPTTCPWSRRTSTVTSRPARRQTGSTWGARRVSAPTRRACWVYATCTAMCASGAPKTTIQRRGQSWLRGWWDYWADHSARVPSSQPPTFPARVRRAFSRGARTGSSGAAASAATPGSAARRSAAGPCRGTGSASWAFALPAVPSGSGSGRQERTTA